MLLTYDMLSLLEDGLRRTADRSQDDVWHGSRLILALVVAAGGVAMLILLRFGSSSSASSPGLNALVASFDVATDTPQRFVVGLVTDDQEVVAHGRARLTFSYLGDKGETPVPGPTAWAMWQPVPGTPDDAENEPSISDVNGVYAARDVTFDRAGYWQVDVAMAAIASSVGTASAYRSIALARTASSPTVAHRRCASSRGLPSS